MVPVQSREGPACLTLVTGLLWPRGTVTGFCSLQRGAVPNGGSLSVIGPNFRNRSRFCVQIDELTKNAVLPLFLGGAAYPRVCTLACTDPDSVCLQTA